MRKLLSNGYHPSTPLRMTMCMWLSDLLSKQPRDRHCAHGAAWLHSLTEPRIAAFLIAKVHLHEKVLLIFQNAARVIRV